MANYWDQKIDINTDWGGDDSTSNLPVLGRRVQEFIKTTLQSKIGDIYYHESEERILGFSNIDDRVQYLTDPIAYEELLIASFPVPKGEKGDTGIGVPIGGITGQQLVKKSNADYDFEWQTPEGSGDMLKSEYDKNGNGIVDNAEKVNGFTVETDVPANAKFTDTVYTHPETHPASIILQDSSNRFVSDAEKLAWNDKVDNSRVLTDVPENAKFTDTTYSEITEEEINTGTASTLRTITARRVTFILSKISTLISNAISALTKNDVGLGNVDNTSDLLKPISTATQTALDNKVDKVEGKQLSTEDYTTLEKNKLAGIEEGAEANPEILNIVAGSNITIQETSDSLIISSTSEGGGMPSNTMEVTEGDHVKMEVVNDKLEISVDALNLIAGSNVSIVQEGNNIIISSSGGDGSGGNSYINVEEEVTVAEEDISGNMINITLTHTPVITERFDVFLNGLLIPRSLLSIAGTSLSIDLTTLNVLPIIGDFLSIKYSR